MALYPGAVKKLIRPGVNDPEITPLGVILHTDAGDSASLYNYFNGPSGGVESHFHIPKSKPVEQYRDTGYEADANLKANSFWVNGKRFGFLSVETQGLAGDPWNAYQLAEIKKLILWAKSVHPAIMLRVCPSPTSAGIGYHTLFGSPSAWTPVAKSCPGPVRIKQFNDVLVPWFKTVKPPASTPTTPEADMADLRNDIVGNDSDGSPMTMAEFASRLNALYGWFLDNGKHGARLVRIDKELAEGGDTDAQLDRIEDDTDDGTAAAPLA